MRIALCHEHVIPPLKYGGTERAVAWLGSHLVQLGHDVTLISKRGSYLEGARIIEHDRQRSFESQVPKDVDLIHFFGTPSQEPARPYLVTIQGNGREGEFFLKNTSFVSRKHAENHGAHAYVYNGIEVSDYPCDLVRNDTLVFLAKASWAVKNLDGAVRIARRLGMRLEVLGSRDLPMGMHRWIPSIRGVRYRGMVDDQEKRRILRNAKALLFPVRWHEPFGIAITEALASGCAVFGTPYGSLPEIVTPEVGILSEGETSLVNLIRGRMEMFDPSQCRARVLSGPFTARAMTESYIRQYEAILSGGILDPRQAARLPQTLPGLAGLSAKSLLPWVS